MKKLRKTFALLLAMSLVYVGGGVFFSCSADSDDSTAANPNSPVTEGSGPKPGESTSEKTITALELVKDESVKTEYSVGDELDVSGLSVKVTYSDNSSKTVAVTKEMVSGFDSSAAGEKTLTVTYDEKIAGTYTVSVAEDSVVEITAELADSEKTWNEGDSISASDVKVSAAYLSGKTAQLLSEAYTVSPATLAKGENEITVTYGSGENAKTATFKINAAVLPKILSVSIPTSLTIEAEAESSITATATTEGTPAPAVTYTWSVEGDGLTFTQTNGNVLSIKGNNTDETSSKTVKVTVTATANEKTVSSEECVITVEKHGVTVKNEVKSVSIVESGSKEIACDGELSLTANVSATGSVNAEYDWIVTGDTDSVEVTKDGNKITIKGKNTDTKNTKTVTVKATAKGGETTTAIESEEVTVTIGAAPVVEDTVKSITVVKADSSKSWKEGDSISASDFTVTATYDSGKTATPTSGVSVDTAILAAGNNTITISYSGKTATVTINATALSRTSFTVSNYLSDGDISLSKTANGLALTVPADITASFVKWSVNDAEKSVTGNSATLADLGITKRGQYVVSVVVTGANGTKYTASASVTLSRSAQ